MCCKIWFNLKSLWRFVGKLDENIPLLIVLASEIALQISGVGFISPEWMILALSSWEELHWKER